MYSHSSAQAITAVSMYPEREETRAGWLDRLGASVEGMFAPWARPRAARFGWIVGHAGGHSRTMKELADDKILPLARTLGRRLRREGYTDDLLAQAFALVREVTTTGRCPRALSARARSPTCWLTALGWVQENGATRAMCRPSPTQAFAPVVGASRYKGPDGFLGPIWNLISKSGLL